MKKIFRSLVVGLLALSLFGMVGCDDGNGNGNNNSNGANTITITDIPAPDGEQARVRLENSDLVLQGEGNISSGVLTVTLTAYKMPAMEVMDNWSGTGDFLVKLRINSINSNKSIVYTAGQNKQPTDTISTFSRFKFTKDTSTISYTGNFLIHNQTFIWQ